MDPDKAVDEWDPEAECDDSGEGCITGHYHSRTCPVRANRCYRVAMLRAAGDAVWADGSPVEAGDLTPEQWHALAGIRERHGITRTATLYPGIAGGYVMIEASGMVLGIEPDGHVHS